MYYTSIQFCSQEYLLLIIVGVYQVGGSDKLSHLLVHKVSQIYAVLLCEIFWFQVNLLSNSLALKTDKFYGYTKISEFFINLTILSRNSLPPLPIKQKKTYNSK